MIREALIRSRTPIEELAAQHPDRTVREVLDEGELEEEIERIKQALIAGGYDDVDALRGLHHPAMSRLEEKMGRLANAVGISGHRCEAKVIGRPKDQDIEVILVAHSSDDAEKVTRMKGILAGPLFY